MGRKSSKKRGGAGWFDPASYDPRRLFASAPAPAPTPPPPSTGTPPVLPAVNTVVEEGAAPIQNAGKRLKKHFHVDPTSSKEVGRLLGTRKGDRMLGRKRRRTHKRKH